MAFEYAAVAFHEPRGRHDLLGETGLARHYLGGLEGPREGACVDTGDLFALEGPARLGGLEPALLRESKIQLALPDAARVRGGLSVADQENFLLAHTRRSEERRVGKECRSRWSPYH